MDRMDVSLVEHNASGVTIRVEQPPPPDFAATLERFIRSLDLDEMWACGLSRDSENVVIGVMEELIIRAEIWKVE